MLVDAANLGIASSEGLLNWHLNLFGKCLLPYDEDTLVDLNETGQNMWRWNCLVDCVRALGWWSCMLYLNLKATARNRQPGIDR